jgi:hypothetical protein
LQVALKRSQQRSIFYSHGICQIFDLNIVRSFALNKCQCIADYALGRKCRNGPSILHNRHAFGWTAMPVREQSASNRFLLGHQRQGLHPPLR